VLFLKEFYLYLSGVYSRSLAAVEDYIKLKLIAYQVRGELVFNVLHIVVNFELSSSFYLKLEVVVSNGFFTLLGFNTLCYFFCMFFLLELGDQF